MMIRRRRKPKTGNGIVRLYNDSGRKSLNDCECQYKPSSSSSSTSFSSSSAAAAASSFSSSNSFSLSLSSSSQASGALKDFQMPSEPDRNRVQALDDSVCRATTDRTITSISVLNVIIAMLDLIKSTSVERTALLTAKQCQTIFAQQNSDRSAKNGTTTDSNVTTNVASTEPMTRRTAGPLGVSSLTILYYISFILSLFARHTSSSSDSSRATTKMSGRSPAGRLWRMCLIVIFCVTLTSNNSVNAQSHSEASTTIPATISPSTSLSSSTLPSPLSPTTQSSSKVKPLPVDGAGPADKLVNLSDILNSNYESSTLSTASSSSSSSSASTTEAGSEIVSVVAKPETSGSDSVHIQRISNSPNSYTEEQYVCDSIDIRNSVEQFSKLKNCTVIEGSLQIVLFDNGTVKDFENVTFPKLREITDYFLIFRIMGLQSLAKLFPNLAVIRGRKLLHDYAFVVYEMLQLQEIGLVHLRQIERGNVRIEKNPNLCYVHTVDWRSIARNALITENHNPEKCPKCPRHCPRMQNDESLSLLCWNGEQCQRLPCPDCERMNRTCSADGKCCPEECVGGCYYRDPIKLTSLTCVACRAFVYQNRCYDHCPEGTYEFFGRRCVSKEECQSKHVISYERYKKVFYKAFDNKCELNCPVGFTENVDNPHECTFCGELCPKICQSSVVSNIASAQSLKGCTVINGSLEIAIQGGGSQIVKELEENLKDLKEITEYLKVARSYPLISLNFLKNLEIIRGLKLERGAYALFVVDNVNLQELWTFEKNDMIDERDNEIHSDGEHQKVRRKRIHVPNGRIFIHLNSKLCYNKIQNLQNYMDIAKAKAPWDERDVSRLSNGDRVPCEVAPLNVTIWGIGPMVVGISFDNFKQKLKDRRGLLGYLIYYREAQNHNVSIFDGRDACAQDEWTVVEFDEVDEMPAETATSTIESSTKPPPLNASSSRDSMNDSYAHIMTLPSQYQHILPNLKPFTRYALYIKTYMIASESKGAQSEILYFKTKPDTPSRPRNIFSKATKYSEIFVKWEPPSEPNGEVKRYIVRATKDEVLEQARDFCSESKGVTSSKPKKETSKNIAEEPLNSSHWTSGNSSSPNPAMNPNSLQAFLQAGKCCACKADRIDAADKEQKIAFEDYIINTVYVKRQAIQNSASTAMGKSRKRRNTPTIELSTEALLEHLTTEMITTDPTSTTQASTTLASTSQASTTTPKRFKFTRTVYHQLNVIIDKLEHYSEYTITVEACQNDERTQFERERDTKAKIERELCSVTAVTSVRTLPLAGADDIEQSSLVYQFDNHTNQDSKLTSVFMSWKEPDNPNGYILSYHLEYQQLISEQKQGHPTLHCISRDTYEQHNGVNLQLTPGNYSVRVRARSLADYGNWTESIYIVIDEPSQFSAIFWIVLIIILVPLITALVVSLYLLKQNRAKLDYISVNPEYISAGLYYEPDPAWEIERDCIKLLKELGQGSFGMVYRGELKKDLKVVVPCAVKTVNEHASLRERVDFLKEADVMKSFTDCHHVVKLLGIVSATQPVYVLMEIMPLGDLRKYLRDNRPDNEEAERPVPPPEEILIRFSIQIADGMAYLASKKFVHRDLAARNCMINEELTVKIGDFGMTRDIYETDYYRKGGKGLLPVRWMSPESLKDGLFTTFSDVWSYGIVLWEMATLAAQPYAGLSNEEVLKYVTDGGKMTRPKDCSDVLWTLMEQTWVWKAKSRPTFLKIVDFLLAYVERDSFIPVSYYWQWRTKEKKNKTKGQPGALGSNGKIASTGLEELIPLNTLENAETHEFEDHGDDGDDEPIKFFPISQPVGSNMKIFEDLKNSTSPVDETLHSELSNNNEDDNGTDAAVTLAKSESLSSTSTSEPGSPSSRDSGLNFVQHDESIDVEGHGDSVLREDDDDGLHTNGKQILPGSYPSDASGLSRNSSVVESQNSSPRGSTNGISSGIINGHLMNTNTSFV